MTKERSVRTSGSEEVQRIYASYEMRFRAEASWWKPFDKGEMNTAGHDLLGGGKVRDAIPAFELKKREYPTRGTLGTALEKRTPRTAKAKRRLLPTQGR